MSRLLSGDIYYKGEYIPIEEYRQKISARSLYNLGNEYENTNMFSTNNQSNVASSISTVLNVIPQYNRLQVNTNLLGNAYDAFRDEGSALAKIGLIMLGKQMLFNSAMNLGTAYIPSVDVSQALKGNMKGVFKLNRDNTITVKNKEDRSFLDKVGSVASSVLGIDTYDVFGDANPFDNTVTNVDYLRNTGKAQLTHFYSLVNKNFYKPISEKDNSNFSKTFIDTAEEVGVTIDTSRKSVLSNYTPFTFDNSIYHPYLGISINSEAVVGANKAMRTAYSGNSATVQEYAPTIDYITSNFGRTTKRDIKTKSNWVSTESNFTEDNLEVLDKVVWGRDGLISEAREEIGKGRGSADRIETGSFNNVLNDEKFNIKEGLLEYTKNLLNATSGQFVDITRKAFKRNDTIVGFQGSPLWEANNSDYAIASENNTAKENGIPKYGVRNHTILDPYGVDTTNLMGTQGFAKSIRFKGNSVYEGSPQSVVHKTVLPRIHPTIDNGKMNNENLMFSLENLAVGTIARNEENYGVIDDEYGTPIPLSEVGPFAGRQMWFPPYNIEINEVAIAKYESTVMVGRNEPMYNYMNSERTAILNFSLLVDYPEQLRNKNLTGPNRHKAIADFFAFGGDPVPSEYTIEVIEKRIELLRDSIPEVGEPVDQAEPPDLEVKDVAVHFPNDKPDEGEEDTIINDMYNNPNHYEINDNTLSAADGNGFGLNKHVYFVEGLTANTITTDANDLYRLSGGTNEYDQYDASGITGQYNSINLLNQNIIDVYSTPDTRKYYDITITGTASKLYNSENAKKYNEDLGDRRVVAAKKLVLNRIAALLGDNVAELLVKNKQIQTPKSKGSLGKSDLGAESKNMHEKTVKEERIATIAFARNLVPVDDKEVELNQNQEDNIRVIQEEIQVLELRLKYLKKNLVGDNIFNERTKAILNGSEASSLNEFYPAFHSQTPEDFHRRLTFLQQCTRQGAAKRYDIVDPNTNELRARNSVFGRQPICILRVGDFFYTKVVIESVTIDYADTTWDMNPEGFGMQPMMANITLQMKVIGGQSLQGPIDALQNAASFNYYANSSFTQKGMYARPSADATAQLQYMKGVDGKTGIVGEKTENLNTKYNALLKKREGDK